MAQSRETTEAEIEIERLIKTRTVEFVRIELPDTHGCSRGLTISAPYFLKQYKKGFADCQFAISQTPIGDLVLGTGIVEEIGYENGGYFADVSTFRVLPWLDATASVLVDMRMTMDVESALHPACSRSICQQQLERLSGMGYQLYSAFEYEFYVLDGKTGQRVNEDVNFLATQNTARYAGLSNDIMRNMISIGINPEHFHAEFGPAQVELTFSPEFGIKSPDNAFRYKQLVKDMAMKHGYTANFMTKPFANVSGSSGHFNMSLWNSEGKNVFYDAEAKYGMSKVACQWLAGLVAHADTLLCFSNQTPNCFERTNSGGFAPTTNAWGLDNRSLAYRVKNHGTDNLYFEIRVSAAGSNPYLLQSACMIAGMDGIEKEMELIGDPYEGEIANAGSDIPEHIKRLPQSLTSALQCLENNEVFVKELSGEFMKLYTVMKKYEEDLANKHRAEDADIFQWYRAYYGEYL